MIDEQAHAAAFAQLTPEQRRMVLDELSRELPDYEHQSAERYDDPRSLARMAIRAEMQRPGTLERTFSGMAMPGVGLGGVMMGGFFSGFAGMIVGSWVVSEFFDNSGYDQGMDTGDVGDFGAEVLAAEISAAVSRNEPLLAREQLSRGRRPSFAASSRRQTL